MPEHNSAIRRHDDLCAHIFGTSATLVGVCLTVVGVIRIVGPLIRFRSIADELLAIDSLAFVTTCIFAYQALRTDDAVRRNRLERVADSVFMASLGLMTIICSLIAYELI